MCLAQEPQRSDASEARTRGPSVSRQALYHWATVLPSVKLDLNFKSIKTYKTISVKLDLNFKSIKNIQNYQCKAGSQF